MRKTKTPTPKENAPEPTTQETANAPDWVNETPDDTEYLVTMHDQEFQPEQQVNLTRGEFIRLKRWLAALRGYSLGTPLDEFAAHNLKNKPEHEQEFRRITITQEEIEIVMDIERVGDELCLNLRRRLKEGATVEPGKWRLSDECHDSIESFEQATVAGAERCGLEIILTRETKTGAAAA
jgi:hypothetical protein